MIARVRDGLSVGLLVVYYKNDKMSVDSCEKYVSLRGVGRIVKSPCVLLRYVFWCAIK